MPARGYSHTPNKKRPTAKRKQSGNLATAKVSGTGKAGVGAHADSKPKPKQVKRPVRKVDPQVKRDARESETAKGRMDRALSDLEHGAAKARLTKVKRKKKSVGGLAGNIVRNARDIVTGAPASVVALAKAEGEELGNLTKRVIASAGGPKAREAPGFDPIKKGIQKSDPVYALGEAAVKKVKGDDAGARRALKRAGDNAYERPLDAAGYMAGAAGAVGKGATIVKHRGKGGTAAARARPPKRVGGENTSSKAQVERQREAAKAEVRARQGHEPSKRTAAKVKREPAVRKEQQYSANAATRTVQKKLENRKARKGQDPFQATPRQAKRMRKRRFDQHTRNTKAGGLAREQQAAQQAHRQRRKLGRDQTKIAAAQLLANQRVREGREAEDLAKLERTANRRGATANVKRLRKITPETLKDPKVKAVAAEQRASLRESEAREKAEGYFGDTNPEFVAALQPHLARGDVVQRTKGDPTPQREVKPSPPPKVVSARAKPRQDPPPAASNRQDQPAVIPRPRPDEPTGTPKKDPPASATALGVTVTRLKEVDTEIALIEKAAREAARVLHPNARTKGDRIVGGRGKKRLLVKDGSFRDPKNLAALRNERVELRKQVEQLRAAVALDEAKANAGPSRPLPPVRELTPAERARHDNPKRNDLTPDERKIVAEQREREALMRTPEKRAARVEAAHAAGIEPHPADLAGSGSARLVSAELGGSRSGITAGDRDRATREGKQHDDQAQPDVVEEPVLHAPAPSQPKGSPHKRTSVRVDADGYYWTTGPKAGERVTEADLAGEQGAFIRGLDRHADPSTDLRTPQAGHGYSAEDAILGSLDENRVEKTQIERERRISLTRLVRAVETDFAVKVGNKTRFAHDRAQTLAQRRDGMATLKVNENESIIVPAEIAARWKQQIMLPSKTERAGRYVTRQFIRTVLPFSVGWQAGNVVDLYTRLIVSDARFAVPGLAGASGRDLVAAVETAMRDLDPHLADELTQALKGHFGARSTVDPLKFSDITQDARSALIRAAGEKVSAVRDVPGVKQAADLGRGVTDKAFQLGVRAESAMVRRASGVAMQNYARALGHDIADHQALAVKLAGEFKDDPAKLLEFQRRTLEITGDYVTRGPGIKATQHVLVPFVQWIKAANKFVFHTLPVGHPYKTAMMLWAAAATEDQRRQLGLSNYITASEARKLNLPAPGRGYLAGALPIGAGKLLPVSPLTSFGEAARIIEGVEDLAEGDDPLRDSKTLLSPVVPLVQGPTRAGLDYGPLVAGSRVVEGLVPGTKQARRAMEGERPHPRSTVIKPIGTGGKSTADRILAGMTAPVGREFPESEKEKRERPEVDTGPQMNIHNAIRPGETKKVVVTGPGGKKRTITVKRTR
jgi:hypothetical protein